jgi:nucleoside-diphosphate-sugar epimerase
MSFNPHEVITPSVNLTKRLLEAASQNSSIKRFVYTSSAATLPIFSSHHVTASSWMSDSVIEIAWSEPYKQENVLPVYASSKILAERACWDFVREKNPAFQLNTVVPMTNIGAFIDARLISSMNGLVLGLWKGDEHAISRLRNFGPNRLINLEDCALLHLAALTLEDVHAERILGLGQAYTFNDIIDAMRKIDPTHDLPEKLETPGNINFTVDVSRTEHLLARVGKFGMTGLEESVRQCVTTA